MSRPQPDTETIKYTFPDTCTEEEIKKAIAEYRKRCPEDLRSSASLRPMAIKYLMRGKKP